MSSYAKDLGTAKTIAQAAIENAQEARASMHEFHGMAAAHGPHCG